MLVDEKVMDMEINAIAMFIKNGVDFTTKDLDKFTNYSIDFTDKNGNDGTISVVVYKEIREYVLYTSKESDNFEMRNFIKCKTDKAIDTYIQRFI